MQGVKLLIVLLPASLTFLLLIKNSRASSGIFPINPEQYEPNAVSLKDKVLLLRKQALKSLTIL